MSMDVYSLRIRVPDDGRGRRGIYGTVTLVGSTDCQDIYNRSRSDCQFIGPGDSDLLLTGPRRPFDPCDYVNFVVALKDRDFDPSSYNYPPKHRCPTECHKSYCCGTYSYEQACSISWKFNLIQLCFVSYHNQVFNKAVTLDNFGNEYNPTWSVTVKYARFTDSVRANIEVVLINNNPHNQFDNDDDDHANVYGRITACISNFTEESVLFQRKNVSSDSDSEEISESDRGVNVRHGELIPLSRSFVVLQSTSPGLTVQADLWDRSRDDGVQMAKGIANFPVQLDVPFERTISGQCGKIRVKVTCARIRPKYE